MQTDYLFHGLKGFKRLQSVCYRLQMQTNTALKRLKILKFYDKWDLDATLEAFDISRRTLYRWKALYKESDGDILSLNPRSKAPKKKRQSQTPGEIVEKIRELRSTYPNMGKAKLYHLLKPWCEENRLPVVSESTIGRVIANDKDKMRLIPYRIDSKGNVKPKRRVFKNRKPKNLKSKPMRLWAVDTIQRVCDGMRRYIMTLVDPHSRVAFAVAIPTRHSKHTANVLNALLEGLFDTAHVTTKPRSFCILSDNGSEFMKLFDALVQEKGLTHYWTYPRSPKMNAHNERFNRTLQEQFVDFHEDLLFTDIELFNQKMAEWLVDYNTLIPHHSLRLKPPVQYLIEHHPECHMWWTNTCYL
ncbi:integrase core domain-containing protein [Hydrogenimonas urashimensis]|uniref:integrase core domain-containing protein n=1 Tax=Hydrogenimonas urashimensis TaxID=2740515 RepID=UPI001915C113|nr:integrase core domain-containing protein [Hydrogenimonas urashimensis]